MRITKPQKIDEFSQVLRGAGLRMMNPYEFEKKFREYVHNKGYRILGYGGKNILDSPLKDGLDYTISKIKDGTIKNLEIDPKTNNFIICPDKWDYTQTNFGPRKQDARQTRQPRRATQPRRTFDHIDEYLARGRGSQSTENFVDPFIEPRNYDDAPEYHSFANAPGYRSYADAPKLHRPDETQSDSEYGDIRLENIFSREGLSVIFSGIFILVIVFRVIMFAITKMPISTKFWSWFIALAATKGMIFDAREFSLAGKAAILIIVWLAASKFI